MFPDDPGFVAAADAVARAHSSSGDGPTWSAKGRRVRDGWWLLSRLIPPSGERRWSAVENKWALPQDEGGAECGQSRL